MANKNKYLAQDAAAVENPLSFTSSAGSATVDAAVTTTDNNIQLILDLISLEGAEATIRRGFLDEMSPACRITLYKILSDLKAAVAV